ncbi:hypothetical protein K490DRAFT_55320 [Saccharata proteae CBS 121410]|uniref:UDENN domain-containing protein n=1 Tax=Saccharata proteae CBS 121410 TaxID=1314787 RepID=A0A6A5YDH4_9PEZI|nr:hypothetical protein K490DRAFT_55320 [Saccharata proteae CBS 121410]
MDQHPPFPPIVCIVDFHHARGPEVERWIGVEEGTDPAAENEWPLLPFMALSDGAHASVEDFSYFTLRHECTSDRPATSLFGISCTRQLDANELVNRPPEVTRSTVQKAVVVISDSPQHFGHLREKLSVVTTAWFAQKDFTDLDILQRFQESLAKTFKDREHERDQYFGLGLRELVHEYKYQTLVLFKSCLLQPKMLFFGSQCERLCLLQFSLISLIPGLIRKLQDCADPAFNSYEEGLVRPTSLKTSERASLLAYMGLPLQIFGKHLELTRAQGSLFGPYTPLQQLDMLADRDTKSYIVGSTNSLLLQQKDRYSDILINLDEDTITISSEPLRRALVLSTPDRRWIDFLTQAVHDTWDEANPSRPNTLGYAGSEEFIRLQFEEYLLALLSATKYRLYCDAHKDSPIKGPVISEIDGDPAADFGHDFLAAWMKTENFRIFNNITDEHIFDIVVPEHPCTGGLTIEDVQRRLNAQVEALHLDERFAQGKETFKELRESGTKKVSTAFNKVWTDIEAMREAQRRKHEEDKRAKAAAEAAEASDTASCKSPTVSEAPSMGAGARAGAYFSSWGAWASEKRRNWGKGGTGGVSTPVPQSPVESKASMDTKFSLDSRDEAEGEKLEREYGGYGRVAESEGHQYEHEHEHEYEDHEEKDSEEPKQFAGEETKKTADKAGYEELEHEAKSSPTELKHPTALEQEVEGTHDIWKA